MSAPILLTTFATWKPEQSSNSSDDLVAELLQRDRLKHPFHLLRQVPVNFHYAPAHVLAKLEELQPRAVICCGMAEKRSMLTVEANGKFRDETLFTSVDVQALVHPLANTHVSHDAGTFVCNHLYYSLLKHIRDQQRACECVFVHVPVLTQHNVEAIVEDFWRILQRFKDSQ